MTTKYISITSPEPWADRLVKDVLMNSTNWKLPLPEVHVSSEMYPALAYAIDFYVGGHESSFVALVNKDGIVDAGRKVSSKGYYHYIGA